MYKKTNIFMISLLVTILLILAAGIGFAADYDFGGKTVTLDISYRSTKSWVQDSTEQAYTMPSLEGHLADIEERFNVNIDFATYSGSDKLEASILAGSPEADIILKDNITMVEMARKGLLYPLTELLEDNDYGNYPQLFEDHWEWYQYQGEIVGLPYPEFPLSTQTIFFNQDLFEEQGLPDLYKLYENKEWTWDKLLEVIEQVDTDSDGDGNVDIYPYASRRKLHHELFYLAMSNNAKFHKNIDGRQVVTIDSPEFMDAARFAKKLYDNGYMNLDLPDMRNTFMEGNLAMINDGLWIAGKYSLDVDMQFDWGMLPIPMGPNADDYSSYAYESKAFYFPISVDNPEGLIELTNALFFLTDKYEEEDAWKNRRDMYLMEIIPDRTALKVVSEILDKAEKHYFTKTMFKDIRSMIEDGEDINSAIPAYVPEAQDYINKIYN